MIRAWVAALILAGHCIAAGPTPGPAADNEAREFINGRWFDGKDFAPARFYAVDGMLTLDRPATEARIVDLGGGFVIPPLGDAHCHHFDNPGLIDALTRQYLLDGVFYARSLGNTTSGKMAVAARVNTLKGVDVAYADLFLTASQGHPTLVYEALALGFYGGAGVADHMDEIRASRKAEGSAYLVIDNERDLEAKWPQVVASKPDFLKLILLDTENYGRFKDDPAKYGQKGLDPKIVPAIVAKARSQGLATAAHIETAADFRVAVNAGVSQIGHLPGYGLGLDQDATRYELTDADAALAADRGVVVTPTYGLIDVYAGKDRAMIDRARSLQAKNLEVLKARGVRLAIGSDSYGSGPLAEIRHLRSLGVYDDRELLAACTGSTARAIFPGRKIGRLAPGYEANFLVLKEDPTVDLDRLGGITLRVKRGETVEPTPGPAR